MRKAVGFGLALSFVLALVSGCGEAVPSGVEIVTQPPGAEVRLAGQVVGKSPVMVPREMILNERLGTLTLEIAKEGYVSQYLVLDQRGGVLQVRLQKKS